MAGETNWTEGFSEEQASYVQEKGFEGPSALLESHQALEKAGGGGKWTDGFSEEQGGYVTNKGWQNPGALLESYQNFEKLHGVPQERIIKIPTEQTPEAMNDIYTKLGRPAKPEDYGITTEDEKEKAVLDGLSSKCHELGLNTDQARGVTEYLQGEVKTGESDLADQQKVKVQQDTEQLQKDWGAKFDENKAQAQAAAKEFDITDEMLAGLEGALGFKAAMTFLQQVGSKLGEAAFHDGGDGGEGNKTPAQALAEIKELRMDAGFMGKYMDATQIGHKEAEEKMSNLYKFAYPEAQA